MEMFDKLMSLGKYENCDCGLAMKLEKLTYPCKTYRSGQEGSVLIGLVIVMVIFAVLSLSLLPLFSTSSMHQVRANQALRAHYLAESGYRYAAGEFLNGGTGEDRDDVLSVMHDREYIFDGNTSAFKLDIETYYYNYKDIDGATLKTEGFGDVPRTIPTNGGGVSGTLAIFNDPEFYRDFTGYSISSDREIHFTIPGGVSPAGTRVFPVVMGSTTQTIAKGDAISFTKTGVLFPPRFGAFRVYDASGNEKYGEIYAYEEIDLTSNQLVGITNLLNPDTDFSIDIDTDDHIVLQRFLQFTSTGKFGDLTGSYATKTLAYYVPLEATTSLGSEGTIELSGDDLLNDMAENDSPGAALGDFGMQDVGGDPALMIEKASGGGAAKRVESIVGIPERNPNPFYLSWSDAGNFLSYDVQVKIAEGTPDTGGTFADKPEHYFAGISFRLTGDNVSSVSSYGISFMRSTTEDGDGIPDDLVPDYSQGGPVSSYVDTPTILLWGREARGIALPGDVWLAAMRIPGGDAVLDQPPDGNDIEDWVVNTNFAVDDVVSHNDREYICTVAHTSTSGTNSNEPGAGKNWKDFWEVHEAIYLSDWATIVVRNIEAASIRHEEGTTSVATGDRVTGLTSGATGKVVKIIQTDRGEIFLLNNLTGTFQASEQVASGTAAAVTAVEWSAKDNYIWAFYGDQEDQGTANDIPHDYANRLGNPRSGGDISWPVDDVSGWTADNDYFTLVKWEKINTSYDVELLGEGSEENAIIRSSIWITADDLYDNPPEVGLHALGTEIEDKIYYDNLAIKMKGGGGERTVGFLQPSLVEQK